MNLIKQLNEASKMATLHVTGHSDVDGKGENLIQGYVYDPETDHEQEVVVHFDYDPPEKATYDYPGAHAQIHINKVVRSGGGEVDLSHVDVEPAVEELLALADEYRRNPRGY